MKYIAVVCQKDVDISSGTNVAWTSFIGSDKDDVITRALEYRDQSYPHCSYVVYCGELRYEAVPRAEYSLREL